MTRLSRPFFGNLWLVALSLTILLGEIDSSDAFQRNRKHSLTGSVTDSTGNPITGAKIVLAHKSWPKNRFRMKTYASKTREDGVFEFRNQYYAQQPSEFLITVVADGYAMTSEYLENRNGRKLDRLEFQLDEAITKTIVLNPNGQPLSKTKVFAKSRTTRDGDEYFIYPISSSKLTLQTDSAGKVRMNIFQPGDRVVLGVSRKGQVEEVKLTIDEKPEQAAGGSDSPGSRSIAAKVLDDTGNPIPGAKILVSHKTWPNNRFRMRSYHGMTDSKGHYALDGAYDNDGRNGILISVLAEGYLMKSQYLSTTGEAIKAFEFKLAAAKNRALEFKDSNGKDLGHSKVLPVSRKDRDGQEHLIYPASAKDISFTTDSKGTTELALFEEGDEVEFLVQLPGGSERVKVTVEAGASQSITVKKKLIP